MANDEAECCSLPRKPRILVVCCGCAEAARFGNICEHLVEWAGQLSQKHLCFSFLNKKFPII